MNLYWESYADGIRTGYGTLDLLPKGSYTILDPAGFDEFRIAAYETPGAASFGGHQAISLDNLSVQLSAHPVPVPSSLLLLAIGLVGLTAMSRPSVSVRRDRRLAVDGRSQARG